MGVITGTIRGKSNLLEESNQSNAMFPAFGWAFWKASFHRVTEAKHVLKPGQLHGAQSLLNNTPMDFRPHRNRHGAMMAW